ncbi:hypothetical protein GCM10027048_13010 [Hymenobacter coalescens]
MIVNGLPPWLHPIVAGQDAVDGPRTPYRGGTVLPRYNFAKVPGRGHEKGPADLRRPGPNGAAGGFPAPALSFREDG